MVSNVSAFLRRSPAIGAKIECAFRAGPQRSAHELLFCLSEELGEVRAERTPGLQMKMLRRSAPQHDLGLGEHGARTHADRKLIQTQIQRTAAVQQWRRLRTAKFKAALAVTDVNHRVIKALQRRLKLGGERRALLLGT